MSVAHSVSCKKNHLQPHNFVPAVDGQRGNWEIDKLQKQLLANSAAVPCLQSNFRPACQTVGPQATSGPRQFATTPMKLLSKFSASSFVFFTPKDFKRSRDSYLVCTLQNLKPYRKMQVFHAKIVSVTSCFRSKFKTVRNSSVHLRMLK